MFVVHDSADNWRKVCHGVGNWRKVCHRVGDYTSESMAAGVGDVFSPNNTEKN